MALHPLHQLGAADTPVAAVHLRVQLFLRWLAIIGQLMAVLVIYYGFGFALPLVACLVVIGLAVVLNVVLALRFPASHLLTRRETAGYLAYDITQLGVLLYLTGGVMNPFAVLLLAPVTISASVLDRRTTSLLVILAGVIVSGLALYHEPLPWRGAPPEIPDLLRLGVWVALMLAIAFIPTYVWRVSREGRRMSAALTATRAVLAREQRLSALDGLAAAAAHQLGTPLGTITLVLNEVRAREDLPDGLAEDIALMHEQALRCRDILSSLSSTEGDPMVSQISLRGLLDEAVLEAGLHDKELFVSCRAEEQSATREPQVLRHPELIYGIGNLIENASEFAASTVWVSATYSAEQVIIEIADDGAGFAPDILSHLGAPYTSSRRSKPLSQIAAQVESQAEQIDDSFGLGLGFFIARTLMQRSGGHISARNLKTTEMIEGAMPGGACVRVIWPRHRLEATMDGAH